MSIQINILNLRNTKPQHEWQVRVDRTSVLGNPFYMRSENYRDEVCDKYESYFNDMLKRSKHSGSSNVKAKVFVQELRRLYKIARTYGKLELFCWCAPKRCHAETIKRFLEKHLNAVTSEIYRKPRSQDHIDTYETLGINEAQYFGISETNSKI